MNRSTAQAGFTVTELLISVLIIAVGVVGFATAINLMSTELWIGQRDTEVALLFADQAERLKSTPYEAVQPGSRSDAGYQLSWDVQGSDPKKVILEATFPRRHGGELADTIVFYIRR